MYSFILIVFEMKNAYHCFWIELCTVIFLQ